jgi:glycine/D-amino acid oxidase-like deaminating enzyme
VSAGIPRTLGRRSFLKATGAFATAALALQTTPIARAAQVRSLVPVAVSLDRVTRTTVGLRPYRAGGFVVRAEGHDGKTIVHHFGHGGGGMSLSWGTALLATELALSTEKRVAAVIGCGVIGLSTARMLQDHGFDVVIYAREIPPDTTSNVSGAQWTPTSVFDDEKVDGAFRTAFVRASRFAYLRYQTLLGDDYGVRWIENYDCYDDSNSQFPGGAATALISDLYPQVQKYGPGEHPFPTRYARRFLTMLIEPNRYLRALLRDYALRGGRVVVRAFGSAADLRSLDEPLVMNCTGLGARELTGDAQLEPIRGQLSVLAPQPAVDYITLHGGHYMFPRTDGIVLGGTFQHGNADLQPNALTEAQIVADHAAFFARMPV